MERGPCLASGRTAEIFAWGDDRILKLFLDWCSAAMVERELQAARATAGVGLAVPKVEGIVEAAAKQSVDK